MLATYVQLDKAKKKVEHASEADATDAFNSHAHTLTTLNYRTKNMHLRRHFNNRINCEWHCRCITLKVDGKGSLDWGSSLHTTRR
jgi:hypothetical protein